MVVHVFHGIFDGQNVAGPLFVDAVDHRCERGALARASWTHNKNEPVRLVQQFGCRPWCAKLFERTHTEWNNAKRERQVSPLAEGVGTESSDPTQTKREVDLMVLV